MKNDYNINYRLQQLSQSLSHDTNEPSQGDLNL